MSEFVSGWMVLKSAAEAAEIERLDNGHRWPEADECDWFDTSSGPEYEYLCAASPVTIMSLLAENESLRKDAERYRSMFGDDDSWDYSDRWICESKADVDEMIDSNRSPENP
jgi:hypothetical protein